MKKCKYENLIDDYLYNRLSEEKKEEFEEHYFNCFSCFSKLKERDELITVVKHEGETIFQDKLEHEKARKVTWYNKVLASISPKQWALTAASAALVLIIALGIIPHFKSSTPQFTIDDDLVRSGSIKLISPIIEVADLPSEFRWQKAGEDLKYRIYLYDKELLWTGTTELTSLEIPVNIRNLLKSGVTYSWQVKAFSSEGTLVYVSKRTEFSIIHIN
jgi:hypothetical protein